MTISFVNPVSPRTRINKPSFQGKQEKNNTKYEYQNPEFQKKVSANQLSGYCNISFKASLTGFMPNLGQHVESVPLPNMI